MVGRYAVSDLDVEDILVFAPNAHVDLGYTPFPSRFELEQEILAGVHTNQSGEIGCPVCGCIDLFLKERTSKGVRYRCMSCMYASESEFESVKSRKDITLAQFGLGFECAICGEDIDAYNHDTVMRHVRKCRQNQNQNFSAEKMMLELGQQDPNDPNRMWGPDIISPLFPFKGYERPTEEVRADLQKHLVGQEIRMFGPQSESEARAIKQPMDWWKDVGFSEFQPAGTMGRVTGVSMSNPNQPKIIGVWVTIIKGGSEKHPMGSRVWFHVKDSYFPDSMGLGWTKGDYVGNPKREEYLRNKGITKGFEAPYQPSQTLADYSPEMLKYSSTVTGDFFWDSLKFGQTTRNAEDNQSDDLIWDEEAGLFYDYIEVPQPDGELIVVYWILNEELDQVGKAQISLFNDNLEIDSIFIEPYYQRRGIATSFVNHVVNYWDSELLRFSDAVSDEGVAFIDSFAAEDSLKVYRRMSWEQYFDALDTGYLMPTEMRMKLDGFVSNKSWSISDRFNTSRTPLFDSPLAHLQGEVLPIFEIELLPTDSLIPPYEKAKKGSYPVIDVLSAIPVERVTPFSTSEEVVSFEADDNYEAKNQEYVDDLLRKYPNIPVVHAKTIHDITDTDTIYRIDFPLTMYRATSSRTGTEKIGEIGYLQGTNKNYGMYFDTHFNNGEYMKESDFATVPVRKVYGALTMGAPMKKYLPEDSGELLAIDLEGYYIISVRGDFWSRWFNKIDEHAVPAILGDVQAEDVLMLFEPTMMSAEDNYDSTYGVKQAKIRRRLKKKIKKQAIMGTKAGQWSARKSQELKRQYEAACQRAGLKPYKGQKTKKQQDLTDWSKQGWRTASGKKSSTTGEPYFPAKAVAALKQKGLYAKAKKQKQAATKAGKQNARYSDDIRKVVAKYRAEGVNMKKLDYYQNVLDKSVFPFIDVEWETGDETIAEKIAKRDYSWQDEVEWTSWTPNESKLSKTFVFTDDDPWVELWNLVFFADALSEASGVDIESVVNQNEVQITIEKTQTPIDFVLLEYINEYMRL